MDDGQAPVNTVEIILLTDLFSFSFSWFIDCARFAISRGINIVRHVIGR